MGGKKRALYFTGHRSFKVAWLCFWIYTKFAICGAIWYKHVESHKNFEFQYQALFTFGIHILIFI